ncbi:hypothetical protein ACU8KH_04125 [Lachancea thermotolerans]
MLSGLVLEPNYLSSKEASAHLISVFESTRADISIFVYLDTHLILKYSVTRA